jgi:CubicO group peptidase (beta-lactamase class C family)
MTELETFVDGIVVSQMDDLDPTAMMVTVVRGNEAFAKAYGIADLETRRPADSTTLFRVGSISKTFIWLSVMMLVEEGKIDLDLDVNAYLTQFKIPETFDLPITMNHLMAHRAGFEDTYQYLLHPRHDVSLAEGLGRAIPERVAPPGERTSYTNWGTDLAALIVANVSGMHYDEFVKRRILGPLGMESTTLGDPESIVVNPMNPVSLDARMARPIDIKNGTPKTVRYTRFEPLYASGSVALDARDAARYMQMLLNQTKYEGGRLMSEATWKRMHERVFKDSEGADDMVGGFVHKEIAGLAAIHHAGGSQFSSVMTILATLDLGIFVSVNSRSPNTSPRQIPRMIVLRALGQRIDATEFIEYIDAEAAGELVGTYIINRRSYSTAEKFSFLGKDMVFSVGPDGEAIATSRGTSQIFYPVGNDIWKTADGFRYKAYRDNQGRVFRMSTYEGITTMDRVGFLGSSFGFSMILGLSLIFTVTTLLGAWWRFGREVPSSPLGRRLRVVPITVAIVWLLLAISMVWTMLTIANFDPVRIQSGEVSYPRFAIKAFLFMAIAAAIAALAQVLTVVPVWLKSGWSIWRRIHFTMYAVILVLAVIVMWNWNLIGKPLWDMG